MRLIVPVPGAWIELGGLEASLVEIFELVGDARDAVTRIESRSGPS